MTDIVPKFFRASEETAARRWLARLDWPMLAAVLALSVTGLFFVYSASFHDGNSGSQLIRQSVALAVGLGGMALLAAVPYQVFQTYARPVFVAGVLLLLGVLMAGARLRGSRSWFHFGVFYFQPVEIARLSLAVALAAYVEARKRELGHWTGTLVPIVMTGGMAALILLQPDLSSALSLGPMALAVLFVAGAPLWSLGVLVFVALLALGIPLMGTYFALIPPGVAAGPLESTLRSSFSGRKEFFLFWGGAAAAISAFWWFLRRWRVDVSRATLFVCLGGLAAGLAGSFVVERAIKPYQQKRLIAFLDAAVDPLGAGYNIRQSEIALGSGRFLGQGYMSGSQSQLGFLPEKHTDFIFSLIGEELGFLGAFLVMAAYFWVVFRAFDVAATARDGFGRSHARGLGTYFAFTGVVNMGMVMGLMPVTGVPLPFLSYGGSSLFGAMLAVGLLQSIHSRRYIL